MVQDKATKQPKLNCRNWECGVVIPVANGVSEQGLEDFREDSPKMDSLDVFATIAPIPVKWPAESLEAAKRAPWFFGGD